MGCGILVFMWERPGISKEKLVSQDLAELAPAAEDLIRNLRRRFQSADLELPVVNGFAIPKKDFSAITELNHILGPVLLGS